MSVVASDRVIHLDDVRDVAAPSRNGNEPRSHSWQPNSLIRLAANPPAPPTIGGLLYPGERTVLSGETESMKTWLALILAKAEMDIGLPVCWADLDAMGPGAMLDRLRLLGCQDDQVDDLFLYLQPSEMLDPAKIQELADRIYGTGVRLMVIDAFNPMLNLHGLDPNSGSDIETFWRTIATPLTDAGAATVMLDHVVKNPDSRGKYASGSERKASGAIVHIGFKLLEALRKGGQGRTLLNVHKDRPGYLPRPSIGRLVLTAQGTEIAYRIEPDKSHDESGGFRPTVLMEKISRYLEQQPDEVSRNQIENGVMGNRDAIRTGLETLADEGYVNRVQGPRRAQLFTTLKQYREASDTPPNDFAPTSPDFAPNLRSSHSTTSPKLLPPPTGGEAGRSGAASQGRSHEKPDLATKGEVIHEYNHPIDADTLYDADQDPDDPGRWFDQ